MRRREFITLLGGAAAGWPLAARAQQSAVPVVGVLNGQSPDGYSHLMTALLKGLGEMGYVEGRNLAIEYRWGEGHEDRLPALATDLVRRQVAVIVAGGTPGSTLAAKAAASTIPIVFTTGADPVKLGYVASLNRPGGNVTGVAFLVSELVAKRLELLHQLLPRVTTVAALLDPMRPDAIAMQRDLEEVAQAIGLQLQVLPASTENQIDVAFTALAERKAGALFVGTSPFFNSHRGKIVALAARHVVPAIYEFREYVVDGGLASYGTSIIEAYRQTGIYAGRVLKGEKPSDLPVMQSTKFELVLNLKTAKALGLEVPDRLLALADEVVE
jgi:putative ABC transport system substrate-binding protein